MESPCILVCSIDIEKGICFGCGRTTDEITAWSMMGDERRSAIMAALPERMVGMEQRPRRETRRQRMARENGEPIAPRKTTLS